MVNDSNVLANIKSFTAHTLSKVFSHLEQRQHIHTVLDKATQALHIQIPRLQLDFSLARGENELQSRQYRGMVVDRDQTIGTLVGLTSKLVLKSADPAHDRLVLIPVPRTFGLRTIAHGKTLDQHHVFVNIDKNEAHKVYAYSLDTTLGRVLGSGEVQQSLFLALLHALTSHCLPDLLTGYTGTESALNILQSAAVRSFEFLTADNVELLGQIAALSPLRTFYPTDLMEMQQVLWDQDLPPLSQHPEFRTCSENIVRQAQTMQLFYPDKMPDIDHWKISNPHLEARDAIRSSTFRVYDYGAEWFTSSEDVSYSARDVYTKSARGQRAYIAATMLVRDHVALHSRIPDLKNALLQTHFKSASIEGVSKTFDFSILRFDSGWLGDFEAILKESWCDLHRYLPVVPASCNKYDIMAWLSTIAYAESADMIVLQAFAAFCRSPVMATMKPPVASAFDMSKGSIWKPNEIKAIVNRACKGFDDSEEAELPKQDSETSEQHIHRISALHRNRQGVAVEAFVADMKRQWPSAGPSPPTGTKIHEYINVSAAMREIIVSFDAWYCNLQFMAYLQQTSAVMTSQNVSAIRPPSPLLSAPPQNPEVGNAKKMFGVDRIFTAVPPVVARRHARSTAEDEMTPPVEPQFPQKDQAASSQSDQMKFRVGELCGSLQILAQSKCEKDYVAGLRASCTSLQDLHQSTSSMSNVLPREGLDNLFQGYLKTCENYYETLNLKLAQAVANSESPSDEVGLELQHSPRISPTFWLSQLHRDRFGGLPVPWKAIIIEYGLAVTQLHRAQRLAALSSKPADLIEELGHVGHSNWDPWEFPETLLLEAENGIMIRKEQEFIASRMRNTEDATNIVLQLLMGGGKSSTIVPMLAAYLADREK